MKTSITMNGIWEFIQSLSLSVGNKKWLAERLLESNQMDSILHKQDEEIALVSNSMKRAWSEVQESQQTGTPLPNIDNLIAELQ